MARWLRLLRRTLLERRRTQDDLTAELRFHLDARTDDLIAHGVAPDDARRRARLEFGSVDGYADRAREAAGLQWLADLRADLIYATRLLRRQPGFAVVAMVSLALGIGANTFVFSVLNAVLLRPLPVSHPSELVFIQRPRAPNVSYPIYRDIRDRNTTLSVVAAARLAPMNLDRDGTASRVWGFLVTGNYFDLLGITPAAGRFFHQEEDQPPTPSPVAVLSYNAWMSRFGGARDVIGSTIRINSQAYTVLGVAPAGFNGTELLFRPDVWVPMTMQPQIEARESWLAERRAMNVWQIGRLRPGVTAAEAEANLNAIAASLAREYPKSDDGLQLRVTRPGLIGDVLGGPVRAFTLGVLVLAGLVLLMACVNLAVMLTARGADRQRELAIRLSIGAGAGRIVRQLLTETALLAGLGGVAGLALAYAAARAFSAWRPLVEVPLQLDVTSNVTVMLFAVAVAAVAGLIFGLAPARQAARTDAQAALKGLSRPGRPRRWAVRDVLVTVQVALCFVLTAGCLLALRGLDAALTMPLGFDPRGVTMVGVDVGLAGYDEARGRDFTQRALNAVRRLPGVESAAVSDTLPLNLDQSSSSVVPDDQPDLPASALRSAARYRVSPDYFRTLGIRLLTGRAIDARDAAAAPRVAVINETFAREILRTSSPVGRRFRYGWMGEWIEVVGVVENGKYETLTEAPQPAVFESLAQHYSTSMTLLTRSSLPAAETLASMRSAVAALDPALGLYEVQSVDEMLGVVLFPHRAAAVALGGFGVLALVLAVTGLHGVVSHAVARRQKEIGVRLAIGARPSEVLRLVLARTTLLLAVGAGLGAALVWLGAHVLANIVYEASPRDPVVFAVVGAALVGVGAIAAWAPARRALRVSPLVALRTE